MSEYASALPIRSESDGTDEKVVVKIIDGTPGGTNQVSVDSDKAAKILSTGHDPGAVNRTLRLSELGASTPDGLYSITNNTIPGTIGLIAVQRAASPAASDQIKHLSAITSGSVHALDISLHDAIGNAFSETNPLPVVITESSGAAINDYKDAAATVPAASDNHDYTVTALKTLYLTQLAGSGSGKAKMQVQVETGVATNVFNTRFVFFNSTADPNMTVSLREPISVAAGVRVRVIMTNKDNQNQDLYSTISGHEV